MEKAFRHRTHFLYAENNGRIDGVLSLAEVKSRLFGHSLCSLPYCVYGGPVASRPKRERHLIMLPKNWRKKLNVDHLEYRGFTETHPDWAHKDLIRNFS